MYGVGDEGWWLTRFYVSGFQKEKEDLEEVSTELELADEDDLIPYARPPNPTL